MDWVKGCFAPAPAPVRNEPSTTPEESQKLLNESIVGLRFRRLQTIKKIQDVEKEARQLHANGNKAGALSSLKRKKTLETQLRQLDGQLQNLEQTNMAVDNAAASLDVAHGMKSGSVAIKSIMSQMSVEEVEDIAEDLSEAMTDVHDITEAVSRPFALHETVDESDLEAEMSSWGNNGGTAELDPLNQLDSIATPQTPISIDQTTKKTALKE